MLLVQLRRFQMTVAELFYILVMCACLKMSVIWKVLELQLETLQPNKFIHILTFGGISASFLKLKGFKWQFESRNV